MAIEVITKGQLPSKKSYRARCDHCAAIFRFLKEDSRPSPDPRDSGLSFVKCPTVGCTKEVWNSAWVEEPATPQLSILGNLSFPPGVRMRTAELRNGDDPNYYRDH